MYFLTNLLLYSKALNREIKYIVIMTDIVNFENPMTGVFELGRGHFRIIL